MGINWDEVKLRNERDRLRGCIRQGIREDDPALDGLKAIIAALEAKVAAQKEGKPC